MKVKIAKTDIGFGAVSIYKVDRMVRGCCGMQEKVKRILPLSKGMSGWWQRRAYWFCGKSGAK